MGTVYYPLSPSVAEENAFMEYLNSVYTDPNSPVSYLNAQEVLRFIKRDGRYANVGLTRLKRYMKRFDGYSLHTERRSIRMFRRYVTNMPGTIEIDLLDTSRHADFNKNVHFLLVGIDQFTRETNLAFLVDKTAPVVAQNLTVLLGKFHNKVHAIYCDYGIEFRSERFLKIVEDRAIRIYYAKQGLKAALVERQNRFLRGYFKRYMEQNNTKTYLHVAEQAVNNYNNRKTKRLGGLSPLEVNEHTAGRVNDYLRSIWTPRPRLHKFEFEIGARVRILTEKIIFQRYRENYSREILTVSARFEKDSLEIYSLQDCEAEPIDGYFYRQELQEIRLGPNELSQVSRYVTEERRQGEPYVLVEYKGAGPNGKCREWKRKADVDYA